MLLKLMKVILSFSNKVWDKSSNVNDHHLNNVILQANSATYGPEGLGKVYLKHFLYLQVLFILASSLILASIYYFLYL